MLLQLTLLLLLKLQLLKLLGVVEDRKCHLLLKLMRMRFLMGLWLVVLLNPRRLGGLLSST
jgi:hypothetical protein